MSALAPVLSAADVRRRIGPDEARQAVREALIALHEGRVEAPPGMSFDFDEPPGDAHVKGAWIRGSERWAVKVAAGFYRNPERGLPASDGLSLAFSAQTGQLQAVVLDGGLLTELRTGGAGGLAAELLARPDIAHALIVGAGGQARYQLQALLAVRDPTRLSVWARRSEAARDFAREAKVSAERAVEVADDLEAAVRAADLIVTTTPTRTPLIHSTWLSPGTHLTAMGSDTPGKQELEPAVLLAADLVAVDLVDAARAHGELQHAPASLQVTPLGAIAAGASPGRTADEQITVADLVGVGAEDAAIVDVLLRQASDSHHRTNQEDMT